MCDRDHLTLDVIGWFKVIVLIAACLEYHVVNMERHDSGLKALSQRADTFSSTLLTDREKYFD